MDISVVKTRRNTGIALLGIGTMKWNEIEYREREAERFMRLKLYQDGVKPDSFLKWSSAVASMR